ncbi:MAG TPA: BamA/TamA family outer membrane protein [Coleofasciculaceae cyanobacterium]
MPIRDLPLLQLPLALALGTAFNLLFVTASWGQLVVLPSGEPQPSEPQPSELPSEPQPSASQPSELQPSASQNSGWTAEQRPDAPTAVSQPDELADDVPVAPSGKGTIADIQIQFVDQDGQPQTGTTREFIIRREFELQPGDAYDPALAQQGLDRLSRLDIVRKASLTLEPTVDPNQVLLVIQVVERRSFHVGFSTNAPSPSALPGPFQPTSVSPGITEKTGLAAGASVGFRNLGGNDQDLTLRVRGGETVLDTELSFLDPWIATDSHRTGYAVNVFSQRSTQGVFTGGDREVNLPNGDTPWVHRLGGGVEVFRAIASDLRVAAGVSYQRVSVRDDFFTNQVFSRDELGNALTVSDSGQDDLLTLRLAADFDRRDNADAPNSGYRILLGLDQAIPVGNASIEFTRLTGNYIQYLPTRFLSLTDANSTLVLNLQAGTMLGDVPPYDAFDLNSGPVQGYNGIDLGTGSSFVQAAAEYRFPIANFRVFNQPIGLGAALFTGYTSALGTASEVIGQPSIVREKPGDGFAYGVGLRANTPLGLVRLELGFSSGGSAVVITTGDRF